SPALAGAPLELPIDVLHAKPQYVTSNPNAPTYDLRTVVQQLLRNLVDEERQAKVMKIEVWAPGLGQAEPDFPGCGKLTNPRRKNYPQYEIVHFVGRVERGRQDAALVLDRREKIETEALQEALVAA